MDEMISRQAAIDTVKGLPTWWADSGGFYGKAQPPMEALLVPDDVISAIENLPAAESLTDKEQRIFLSAMKRERDICVEIDKIMTREPYEDNLAWICDEIERKVKGALWTN